MCQLDLKFHVDSSALLVIQSTIVCSIHTVVLKSLQTRFPHLAHYLTQVGHLGQRRVYESMRLEYYWMHMVSHFYTIVDDCKHCAKKRAMLKHECHLILVPPTSPLDSSAVDILGPLPRTKNGNRFDVVITDRCSKLTRAIQTTKTSTSYTAKTLFDNSMFLEGIPLFLLPYNSPQFVGQAV